MTNARYSANAVLLPGRMLLIVGGRNTAVLPNGYVLDPELLDLENPTATWQVLAPHSQGRAYHSFALLLPDGRVLVGGGQRLNQTLPYYHAQIFSPPNLFAGPRPMISPGTDRDVTYGGTLTVRMSTVPPAGIGSFELIRPGSVTHSTDFEQRLVRLAFTPGAGPNEFVITAPATPDLAPPGWYMLFAVSGPAAGQRVPSVAHFVLLQ
ncbi:MAG TPA: galactose oxidase early set domain-containing protein [Planctomycetota bacterium]|nr:galactose oxidase early set domain-containing protein [Planctomycetota bacterium]